MTSQKSILWRWGALCVLALSACTAIPPAAPAPDESASLRAVYAQLANTGGKVMTIDPTASRVRIYVFRAGPAARLGHNHVLSVPQLAGFLLAPTGEASTARFDLAFRLDQLEVDNPDHRSSVGGAFASPLTAQDIQGTRDHMLGSQGLQADRYPLVHIHALQMTGESPQWAAHIQVDMHGQTHTSWVPLAVEAAPDHLSVTGSWVLHQSDFGIKPYAILGGLIAIQDAVIVEFKLIGHAQ